MRSDRERLLDIEEAVDRIGRYAVRGRAEFERDELIQNWIVHQLQILGEAAARLTPEFRADHPEIPWRQIVGMRNVLMHGYFEIDLDMSGRSSWTSCRSCVTRSELSREPFAETMDGVPIRGGRRR